MSTSLHGKRVAILATDGFEEDELLKPLHALEAAGGQVDVVSPGGGWIKGWKHTDWGEEVAVDVELRKAAATAYDGLMLPGGVINADKLRVMPEAVAFVRQFVLAHKPIGAICHAAWTLLEADAVRGRKMTSWPSLKTDLVNAGANWADEVCIVDSGAFPLVTSRKPDDLDEFDKHLVEEIARWKRHATAA
jgi:protease I